MWICIDNLDQVIWVAENYKLAWVSKFIQHGTGKENKHYMINFVDLLFEDFNIVLLISNIYGHQTNITTKKKGVNNVANQQTFVQPCFIRNANRIINILESIEPI